MNPPHGPQPLYIVTTDEMRAIESASHAKGHTYDDMMRRAGAGVARAVAEQIDSGVVLVLCGPGNNGGDALVAAGLLKAAGYDVRVVLWGRAATSALPEVDTQLGDAAVLSIEGEGALGRVEAWLAEAGAVIDGLLGTGLKRALEPPLTDLLDLVAGAKALGDGPLVVAVDVPTGLDADGGGLDPHALAADITVTFGYPKQGQVRFPGASAVGELVVEDIGLAPDLFAGPVDLATDRSVAALLPARPIDGHKGTFGRLLVVAGSIQYTGAACLAAAAAYRVGCGLVTAAVPTSVRPVLAAMLPEATFVVLPEDLGVVTRSAAPLVSEAAAECDAWVLGPGLTTAPSAGQFVAALLGGPGAGADGLIGFAGLRPDARPEAGLPPSAALPLKLVLDADGLNLLDASTIAGLPADTVLTPHPGEMSRLAGQPTSEIQADRIEVARQAAARWQRVVLLKGAFSVVAAPDGRATVLPFATSALAKAGTGDVLAGAVGGLLAQGLGPREAAIAAGYVHGLAGELAAEALGPRSVTASDVLARLGRALARIEAAS